METYLPKVILCPTDYSELATFSLRYGNKLAICSGAKLLVIYADPFLPPPYFTASQMDELAWNFDLAKKASKEHLARYVRSHIDPEVKSESLVVVYTPVTAILQTAQERKADLIVMGTHGRGGISRVMLGSVTERVLREAHCPVLSMRHLDGLPEPQGLEFRQILCPVNFTEVSRLALRHTVSLAEWFDANVLVLHVAEPPVDPASSNQLKDQLCQWVSPSLRTRCVLKEMVDQGHAAEQIIQLARTLHCDLIVMGAQHKRFFDTTVLGTTTVRVTRHASCPVLTVVSS
ncbi:MAG: universal stress protein [Terriglobia bacterium]